MKWTKLCCACDDSPMVCMISACTFWFVCTLTHPHFFLFGCKYLGSEQELHYIKFLAPLWKYFLFIPYSISVSSAVGMHCVSCMLPTPKSGAYSLVSKAAVPWQAWSGPGGSRKLRFADFMTTAQDGGKVVSLMHRPPLPPGNAHFC